MTYERERRHDQQHREFVSGLHALARQADDLNLTDYSGVLDALSEGATVRLDVDPLDVPIPLVLTPAVTQGRSVRIALSGIESMSDELYAADKEAEYALLDAEQAEDDAALDAAAEARAEDLSFEYHRDRKHDAVEFQGGVA